MTEIAMKQVFISVSLLKNIRLKKIYGYKFSRKQTRLREMIFRYIKVI
jgi:hypothetical protein